MAKTAKPVEGKDTTFDELIGDLFPEDVDIVKASQENNPLEPISTLKGLNYEETTLRSQNKATEMVRSIVSYYLTEELQQHNYIKNKMDLDIITISNLLFNMETSEHALKALLNEIDQGNLHPRMFEVLSGLQKAKMEIVKHLKQVEIIMENNYKMLMKECEDRKVLLGDDIMQKNEHQIGYKAI